MPGHPARGSLYGHGLLGSGTEITSDSQEKLASEHDFIICATDWWGMSGGDVSYDISALENLNKLRPSSTASCRACSTPSSCRA